MTSTSQPLTLTETDEAILAACNSSDGAIEDVEVVEKRGPLLLRVGCNGGRESDHGCGQH
jgi:hypothetical protein